MTTSSTPPPEAPTRPSYSVRTPEDLIALVPVVLGFEPEESVSVVSFGARDGGPPGPGFHARVDLPTTPGAGAGADLRAAGEGGGVGDGAGGVAGAPPALVRELDAVVATLVEPVVRHGVPRLAAVVHSERPALAALAGQRLVAAVGAHAPLTEVVEVLHADGRRWRPLLSGRPAWAYDGVPYDVTHHPLRLQAVVDGRVTHASRAALAATLDPDVPGVRRVAAAIEAADAVEAVEAVEAAEAVGAAGPGAEAAGRDVGAERSWVAATVREAVRSGRAPDDRTAARLLRAVADGRVRDAASTAVARAEAEAHVALWRDLLRRSPAPVRGSAAALLALAAWVAGDGALAWCALDRCEEVAPGHGLAELVATALERAVPPGEWEAVRVSLVGAAADAPA